MFLHYVNDIADKISPQTRIKLFADDCLLYRTIDIKQDHKQLQQDLNTLVDWSHTWMMTFNAQKHQGTHDDNLNGNNYKALHKISIFLEIVKKNTDFSYKSNKQNMEK
jgi:hypothetical protein